MKNFKRNVYTNHNKGIIVFYSACYYNMKAELRSKTIKRNIFASFFIKGIVILISLVLIPLTIGYVSSELYGIWLTLATIISWAGLFDLGFANGLKNKVAESIAQDDWSKAQRQVSTAYFFFSVVFIPVCAFVYFGCSIVDWPKLLNVSSHYGLLLIDVIRLVIIFFGVNMIIKIQNVVLQALQLNALASFFDAIGQLLTLFGVWILTQTTAPSLLYLAVTISLCPIIVNLFASFWIYGIKFKKLRPSYKFVVRSYIGDILTLGVNFFVLQIAVLVLYQTMNIIISNVAGPDAVTEYNVIYKYMSVPLMCTSIISAPFWSAFTDAFTQKDYVWMKKAYHKLISIFFLLVMFVFILIIIYPFIFDLWLGNKVVIHFSMIIGVAVYVVIMMWNSVHSSLINGTGRIRLSLYMSIISTILNVPLALFLGKIYGALGVVTSVGLLNLIGVVQMRLQIIKILNNKANGIWGK